MTAEERAMELMGALCPHSQISGQIAARSCLDCLTIAINAAVEEERERATELLASCRKLSAERLSLIGRITPELVALRAELAAARPFVEAVRRWTRAQDQDGFSDALIAEDNAAHAALLALGRGKT